MQPIPFSVIRAQALADRATNTQRISLRIDYWREVAAELADELMPDTRAQECALADVGA